MWLSFPIGLPIAESFTVMLHVVTCWLATEDAANDLVSEAFETENAGTFVYDADPDKAFCESHSQGQLI